MSALPEDARNKFEEEAERLAPYDDSSSYTILDYKEHKITVDGNRLDLMSVMSFGYNSRNEEVERLKSEVPKWIDVNERLPRGDIDVICVSRIGFMTVAHLKNGRFVEGDGEHIYVSGTFTHWMPLPSAL